MPPAPACVRRWRWGRAGLFPRFLGISAWFLSYLQQDFSPCSCERGWQAFLRARGQWRGGPEREPNVLGLARWTCCVVQQGPPAPLGRDSPAWLTGPQAFLPSWGWRVSRGAQDPQPLLLALGALGQVRGERRAPGGRKAALVPRGAAVSASFRDGGLPI